MCVAVVAVPEIDLSRLLAVFSAVTRFHVSRGPVEKDSFWGDGRPITTMAIFPMLLIS